jgi:hypothetical protein
MGNKTVINGNKEVENFRKIKKQEKGAILLTMKSTHKVMHEASNPWRFRQKLFHNLIAVVE